MGKTKINFLTFGDGDNHWIMSAVGTSLRDGKPLAWNRRSTRFSEVLQKDPPTVTAVLDYLPKGRNSAAEGLIGDDFSALEAALCPGLRLPIPGTWISVTRRGELFVPGVEPNMFERLLSVSADSASDEKPLMSAQRKGIEAFLTRGREARQRFLDAHPDYPSVRIG